MRADSALRLVRGTGESLCWSTIDDASLYRATLIAWLSYLRERSFVVLSFIYLFIFFFFTWV